MKHLLGRLSAPLLAAVVLAAWAFLTMPLSSALWREVLGVAGSVSIGAWSPPDPQAGGTSLEAGMSAAGFWQRDGQGDHFGVSGEICVANTGERPAMGLVITDFLQARQGRNGYQDFLSQPVETAAKPVLEPGETYCYPYRIEFDPLPQAQYRSLALVSIANHSGWLPGGSRCPGPETCLFGPQPKAAFRLPEVPTVVSGSPLQGPPSMGGSETRCSAARLLTAGNEPALLEVASGQKGVRRWNVKNTGRCAWDSRYRLIYRGGAGLDAPADLSLLPEGEQVQPGGSTEAAVEFQAPVSPGVFEGQFILLDPEGQAIPVEDSPEGSLWLRVAVVANPSPTALPTRTPLPVPSGTPTPAAQPALDQPQLPLATPTPAVFNLPTSAPAFPALSCTRPVDDWREHPNAWPLEQLLLGNETYTRLEALELLDAQTQTAGILLAQQLIAAKLNLALATGLQGIEPVVRSGDDWLSGHSLAGPLTGPDEKRVLTIARDLEDYNLGKTGPGMCPTMPETPATQTPTASPTFTSTPVPTSAPTENQGSASSPTPSPTAAGIPAQTTTAATAPSPTVTPAPSPTPLPTDAPTPQPSATSAPTETPTPFPTPTPSTPSTETAQEGELVEANESPLSEMPTP